MSDFIRCLGGLSYWQLFLFVIIIGIVFKVFEWILKLSISLILLVISTIVVLYKRGKGE